MSVDGPDATPPTTSSVPQLGQPRQSSVAISRSTGTAYERPERARTSHACEPCRDRKTKCDGERPLCRRCINTGTNCHYGYGKGWRKRKTVEDLDATRRRLARYEALLNEILPQVPANIQSLIEAAKEQDAAASVSGGSETAEDHVMANAGYERDTPTSNPRLPYPGSASGSQYPIPTGQYAPPPLRPYESMSPRLGHAATQSHGSPQAPSPEATRDMRLPSITPGGQLIEPSLIAQGSDMSHQSEPVLYGARERSIGGHESPKGEVSAQHSAPG